MFTSSKASQMEIPGEILVEIQKYLADFEALKSQYTALALKRYQDELACFDAFSWRFKEAAMNHYNKLKTAIEIMKLEHYLFPLVQNYTFHADKAFFSGEIAVAVKQLIARLDSYHSYHEQEIQQRLESYRAEKQKELVLAAAVGAVSKMAGLVAIGVNPNELIQFSEDMACYPLDYAIINLNAEAVAELIKLGARTYRQDALKIAERKTHKPYGSSDAASFYLQKVLADKQKIAAMLEALNPGTSIRNEAGSPLSSMP